MAGVGNKFLVLNSFMKEHCRADSFVACACFYVAEDMEYRRYFLKGFVADGWGGQQVFGVKLLYERALPGG